MIAQLWQLVFINPLSISIEWLAQLTGNVGIAIVLLTIIIQLILFPLRLPSLKSAQKMKEIKPHLDEIRRKHSEDKMAQAQAQMELYREHGISPMGGILPTLLSIPIIIALYQVLLSFLGSIEGVSTNFLWFKVTSPDPIFVLPVLVGMAQFVMSSQMSQTAKVQPNEEKKEKAKEGKTGDQSEEIMEMVQSQMKFIFPVMSGLITLRLPAGVGLYWLTSVVFAIIQQKLVSRK